MSVFLAVKNWNRYQHYKDRSAPWIKLYRDLLTSEAWVLGTDRSRVVQLASMMLAPRYDNKIPYRFDLCKRVMALDCTEQEFTEAVQHLIDTDFLSIQELPNGVSDSVQNASTMLASRYIRGEERRIEERREEKNPSAPAAPLRVKVSRVAVTPDWMLDFKLAYPDRAGDQGWRKAERAANARIAEGHTPEEFIEGAKRYAAFCQSTEKTGSEYVQQAATFLGPGKPFLLPWHPPPKVEQLSPVERVLRANGVKNDERVVAEQFGSSNDSLGILDGDVRDAPYPGFRRIGS